MTSERTLGFSRWTPFLSLFSCCWLVLCVNLRQNSLVMCCEVEVSATGRSLIQRSPTDCGVSNLTHIIYNLRRSSAARLLRLWVRIPLGAWMLVCCECYLLSGRGLCHGLITRPEGFCRLWRVEKSVLKQAKINRSNRWATPEKLPFP